MYWPDFRLSEDLDFITGSPAAEVRASLERAVAVAARVAGIDLILDYGQPKGGWSRSYVRFDQASILIDVNLGEKPYLPVANGAVDLPYSDLRGGERRVPVVTLVGILGNKWFMLGDDDRREPRDLYDVWAGLIRFDVPFSELVRGHRAKYGYGPQEGQLTRALRLQPLWEMRLAHQLAELPSFEDAYAAVLQRLREWQTRSNSQ